MKGFSNQPSMFHPAAVIFKKSVRPVSILVLFIISMYLVALGLAGMELTFLITAHIVGRTHTDTQDDQTGRADRHSWVWCLSSQATTTHTEALLFRKWLDICLLMGSSELHLIFALLPHTAFVFSY